MRCWIKVKREGDIVVCLENAQLDETRDLGVGKACYFNMQPSTEHLRDVVYTFSPVVVGPSRRDSMVLRLEDLPTGLCTVSGDPENFTTHSGAELNDVEQLMLVLRLRGIRFDENQIRNHWNSISSASKSILDEATPAQLSDLLFMIYYAEDIKRICSRTIPDNFVYGRTPGQVRYLNAWQSLISYFGDGSSLLVFMLQDAFWPAYKQVRVTDEQGVTTTQVVAKTLEEQKEYFHRICLSLTIYTAREELILLRLCQIVCSITVDPEEFNSED